MKTLIQSLAKARSNFGSISKDGKALARGNREYRYATLDAILGAVVPALAAEGLHVYHSYEIKDGLLEVTAHLTDGEHELTSKVSLPTSGVNGESNQVQAVGSILTYGRRYSISALLAVCTDQDDDAQGIEALKPEVKPKASLRSSPEVMATTEQLNWIKSKFREYGVPDSQQERILSEAKGKTMRQLIAEIEIAGTKL